MVISFACSFFLCYPPLPLRYVRGWGKSSLLESLLYYLFENSFFLARILSDEGEIHVQFSASDIHKSELVLLLLADLVPLLAF